MAYFSKAKVAYHRTSAHELDPVVRIASAADDMIAILYLEAKIRAVIFKRTLSDALLSDTEQFFERTPNPDSPAAFYPGACITSSPLGTRLKLSDNFETAARNLIHLQKDLKFLGNCFRKATGRLTYVSDPQGRGMIRRWMILEDSEETLQKLSDQSPVHHDGFGGYVLVTSYGRPGTAGTEWFPGSYSMADVELIRQEFKAARDPSALRLKYQVQTLDMGDVMIFKAGSSDIMQEDQLLHKSPIPAIGKPRIFVTLP